MINGFIKKEKKPRKTEKKGEPDVVRALTIEERKTMKHNILTLEDHERLQLYHFIKMDNVSHTSHENGVLVNLSECTEEFIYKIYKFINQCINNQVYRKLS